MNVRLHAIMPDTQAAKKDEQAANAIRVEVTVDETMQFSFTISKDQMDVLKDGKYLAEFIAKHVSEKIKDAFPGFMKVTQRHELGYDYEGSIQFNTNVRMAV